MPNAHSEVDAEIAQPEGQKFVWSRICRKIAIIQIWIKSFRNWPNAYSILLNAASRFIQIVERVPDISVHVVLNWRWRAEVNVFGTQCPFQECLVAIGLHRA